MKKSLIVKTDSKTEVTNWTQTPTTVFNDPKPSQKVVKLPTDNFNMEWARTIIANTEPFNDFINETREKVGNVVWETWNVDPKINEKERKSKREDIIVNKIIMFLGLLEEHFPGKFSDVDHGDSKRDASNYRSIDSVEEVQAFLARVVNNDPTLSDAYKIFRNMCVGIVSTEKGTYMIRLSWKQQKIILAFSEIESEFRDKENLVSQGRNDQTKKAREAANLRDDHLKLTYFWLPKLVGKVKYSELSPKGKEYCDAYHRNNPLEDLGEKGMKLKNIKARRFFVHLWNNNRIHLKNVSKIFEDSEYGNFMDLLQNYPSHACSKLYYDSLENNKSMNYGEPFNATLERLIEEKIKWFDKD